MEIVKNILDNFLYVDKNLASVISFFGVYTYIILFIIIFLETGAVVTPFLPGDSLLFASGAIAATNSLNIWWLFILLSVAAIGGDTANYWLGHYIGPKVFSRDNSRFFKKEYMEKTNKFYAKYGGKTIILARFIPIVRTFAPFVAGVGKMHYGQFISYNIFGGLLWVSLFLFGGFLFGNIPLIKQNFHITIFIIIFVSILPAIVEYIKHKRAKVSEKETIKTDYRALTQTFKKQHLSD